MDDATAFPRLTSVGLRRGEEGREVPAMPTLQHAGGPAGSDAYQHQGVQDRDGTTPPAGHGSAFSIVGVRRWGTMTTLLAAGAVQCIYAFDSGRIKGRLPPMRRRVDAALAMIISQCSGLERSTWGWRPARQLTRKKIWRALQE